MRKIVFPVVALLVALSLFTAMNVSAQCNAGSAASTTCPATTCAQCTSCTTSTCCSCPCAVTTASSTTPCAAVACTVVTSACPVHYSSAEPVQHVWDGYLNRYI